MARSPSQGGKVAVVHEEPRALFLCGVGFLTSASGQEVSSLNSMSANRSVRSGDGAWSSLGGGAFVWRCGRETFDEWSKLGTLRCAISRLHQSESTHAMNRL